MSDRHAASQPLLAPRQSSIPRNNRVSQRSEVILLLLQALASLIFRLWLATITISMLMYFVRRVSVHNIRHQNGQLISDRNVEIVRVGNDEDQMSFTATPALFGKILTETITGNSLLI